jgi:deazaflavin-dependent oxidoreductase (nitroreductase family)
MNSQPKRVPPGTAGTLEPLGPLGPLGPSLIVKIVMRPMTKVLNPLIVKLAGRRHFRMAAQIRHVGRRSGRTYTTPVSARRAGDMVAIALTFGNQSDWSRNIRSAGGGTIRIEGEEYEVTQPQLISREEAKPLVQTAFRPMARAGFAILGIKQIMLLRVVSAEHPPGAAAAANTANTG